MRQNPCFDVVAGLKGSIVASFFWLGWLGGLGGRLMGSVYIWGLPGLFPLFLGGLPALPCDMVLSCRLVACGGLLRSVGEDLGVLLGMYGLQLACRLWYLGRRLRWRVGVMVHLFLPVTTLIG